MIKTKEIEAEGKTFLVSQMSLIQGDRWANRVALALLKSGVDISTIAKKASKKKGGDFFGMIDMVGVINMALKALGGVDDDVAQGLLDELIPLIKVKLPDGSTRGVILESDISDIGTLWKLRIEAIKVNLDFLLAGVTQ